MKWSNAVSLSWVVAGVSLLTNAVLGYQMVQARTNFAALEQRLDEVAIEIAVYSSDDVLLKEVTTYSVGAQTLGEVLEQLHEVELLAVELSGASEFGRYIISIENEVEPSTYWGIFSATNVACAGLESYDGTMTDYCSLGIDSIQVVGGDQFTFKLLGY